MFIVRFVTIFKNKKIGRMEYLYEYYMIIYLNLNKKFI